MLRDITANVRTVRPASEGTGSFIGFTEAEQARMAQAEAEYPVYNLQEGMVEVAKRATNMWREGITPQQYLDSYIPATYMEALAIRRVSTTKSYGLFPMNAIWSELTNEQHAEMHAAWTTYLHQVRSQMAADGDAAMDEEVMTPTDEEPPEAPPSSARR